MVGSKTSFSQRGDNIVKCSYRNHPLKINGKINLFAQFAYTKYINLHVNVFSHAINRSIHILRSANLFVGDKNMS